MDALCREQFNSQAIEKQKIGRDFAADFYSKARGLAEGCVRSNELGADRGN